LRDADLSQALPMSWIQQVVFGFGIETGAGWRKIFKGQEAFLTEYYYWRGSFLSKIFV
jgi:hypothetical protein